ncbi:MAG: hypothetical protein KAQ98_04870 [Bacteriovoracaceae bacterium]|nr:hypothetical protein [Bacteriovoracaceae bacterium]
MNFNFNLFKELMAHRVEDILIISSPYEAFVMQEDGGMLEHVFASYRGISLTRPPTFTKVSTAQEALKVIEIKKFDLVVIHYPKYLGMNAVTLGKKIKEVDKNVPVVLLAHGFRSISQEYVQKLPPDSIDKIFVWSGNRHIMWTIIKWVEDQLNIDHDIEIAKVRVLILIEDSPYYYSSILPILYKAIVSQTQEVIDDTLNEEQSLWKIRARTKILLASNYEDGMRLYEKYRPYLIGVFSDTRYSRDGKIDEKAGLVFLKRVRNELPHLPILLLSNEGINRKNAVENKIYFQDKNSAALHNEIRRFMKKHMGFGDFVFRLPDGKEVAKAGNLYSLEKSLKDIPNQSLLYHIKLNHFSSWLMARTEVNLASKFIKARQQDFSNMDEIRKFLISSLRQHRLNIQRTTVASFQQDHDYALDIDFLRYGEGSLGGKARGLAFMAKYLHDNQKEFDEFDEIKISIPKTLVISTDSFDEFIEKNDLAYFAETDSPNEKTAQIFKSASLPDSLLKTLKIFLEKIHTPLAVRSSSLLEDSRDTPFAGLYSTYMLPNNNSSLDSRLNELTTAVKLIYASVFFREPMAFSRTTQNRTEEEKMAILIQTVAGNMYDNYYYPAISGTALSYNFYPIEPMKAENGVANMSLGLGKIVVEGGQTLRFCPEYPEILPQFSIVDDTLKNSQKSFYAIKMDEGPKELGIDNDASLKKRDIHDAVNEEPIQMLASGYDPLDHRVRDIFMNGQTPIITFSRILRYKQIPLPKLIGKMLQVGRLGFGHEVEIEFAFNVASKQNESHEFVLLQIRPLTTIHESIDAKITKKEISKSICHATNALGQGIISNIMDIILVKPESFSAHNSRNIAMEIGTLNAKLAKENRQYLLAGPGRWGSSDHCLGIPVKWNDISNVSTIIEAKVKNLNADPSQGTHFFQNITSLGIPYFTACDPDSHVDWEWFLNQKVCLETEFIRHIRISKPITVKINCKTNEGVILPPGDHSK